MNRAGLRGGSDYRPRYMVCGVVLLIGGLWISTGAAQSAAPDAVLTLGRTTLRVESRGPTPDLGEASVQEWIERSAHIVRDYFGEFPVRTVSLRLSTMDSDRMGSGRTFGYPEPRIEIKIGQHVTRAALDDDWVLVHEMIHLALPAIADEQNWLAEGVATYVEGIARVQGGNLSEASLWDEYVKSMPKGLPQANDQGLDKTHTWGRTYWGGALFCLLADVQIRERSHTRRGLQDALRAIAHSGAGMAEQWPIERILTVGDSATGTTVLTDLYQKMKDAPYAPDLDALWADLGIVDREGTVRFEDGARMGAVRRAITGAGPSAAGRP
jgi:hypothetical protein